MDCRQKHKSTNINQQILTNQSTGTSGNKLDEKKNKKSDLELNKYILNIARMWLQYTPHYYVGGKNTFFLIDVWSKVIEYESGVE